MQLAQIFRTGWLMIVITILIATQTLAQHHQKRHQHGKRHSLKIVCSFSDYAKIAEYIAGDHVNVDYIASGEQDPHFVPPKPSYAMKLRKADMWITTGLDLEIW